MSTEKTPSSGTSYNQLGDPRQERCIGRLLWKTAVGAAILTGLTTSMSAAYSRCFDEEERRVLTLSNWWTDSSGSVQQPSLFKVEGSLGGGDTLGLSRKPGTKQSRHVSEIDGFTNFIVQQNKQRVYVGPKEEAVDDVASVFADGNNCSIIDIAFKGGKIDGAVFFPRRSLGRRHFHPCEDAVSRLPGLKSDNLNKKGEPTEPITVKIDGRKIPAIGDCREVTLTVKANREDNLVTAETISCE